MSDRYIYELHVFNCPRLVFGKASWKECGCEGPRIWEKIIAAHKNRDTELDSLLMLAEATRVVGEASI